MNGDQVNPTNPGPSQKPQVVDKIKNGTSILVAVSADPSIDQLAAAIALTLLLEKYKKNATAVFSGKVPSALDFLKPRERLQKNTDSLRDFIIAIDKSKADKLRYKVEDNVVKIFITPYKTSITEKDLQYNAGDFNVDVIVALGVQHQADVDTAISAHGRIFHDAVVVSLNNVAGGDFGVAHWEELEASSLSEMVAQLAAELGPNTLDADIATALLTGIVAETGRFSNAKTHPSTMALSSTLLQAGADQQLVNQQLSGVMGTEVRLEAGAEIKPTMSAEQQAEEFRHEEEELVIGEDGRISGVDSPSTEVKPAEEKPVETETPTEEPKPTETDKTGDSGKVPVEPDLVLPAEGEETPKPEEPAPAHDPADDPNEAEAARKAISDALKNAAAEEHATNVVPAAPTEAPPVQPGPGPGAAPVMPPMPPPPQPAIPPQPMVQPTVPPIGSEPAPLANSPADQAFTMPMPPAGAFTQAPPVNMAPNAPAPNAAPAPPPLPPPLPPTQ